MVHSREPMAWQMLLACCQPSWLTSAPPPTSPPMQTLLPRPPLSEAPSPPKPLSDSPQTWSEPRPPGLPQAPP